MEVALGFSRCTFKVFKQIYKPSIRYYSGRIVPINETTVVGRIVLFMNSEYNKPMNKISDEFKNRSKQEIVSVIDKIKLNKTNHISNLKLDQIEELLRTLNYEDYTSNNHHFKKLMNIIDAECCSRLDYFDSGSILRVLNGFTQAVPNKITESKFYGAALSYLMTYIDYLSKEELLQTMFYIGLQKKTRNAQVTMRDCLRKFSNDDIRTLSVEELCIICNSTFKTSTRITNKEILKKVNDTLNDKLYLLKDTALFITLIKTVRHNKYQDNNLLNTISCTILFNETYKYYPFPVVCHILAMYADYQFYDDEILKLFIDIAIKQLEESKIVLPDDPYTKENIRVKDITRFLWILSTFGYKDMDHAVFDKVIVPKIFQRIDAGLYAKDIGELVNCILYLWMLNCQPVNLISYTLTVRNIREIKEIKSQAKSRLNLLLTCVFFENKKLFGELKIKAEKYQPTHIQFQLEERPNLIKVLTVLRRLSGDMAVNKFEVTCEVPHLNVCGITGYTNNTHKTVFIEVLDDYVCLKNKINMPAGLMQLKLRILREMDDALLIVPGDIVEDLPQKELEEYLKSEIEFLC